MGTDLPLLRFPILILLCAQFRIQEVLGTDGSLCWGEAASCALLDPYLATPVGSCRLLHASQLYLGGP